MFPLILGLCYASIFCGCVSGYSDIDYALYFPNKGIIEDNVNIWGMPSLTQFTICFWMKSTATNTGVVFSYSVPDEANEILIYHYNNFGIEVGEKPSADTYTSATDGKWHHICWSWQNSDGAWKFYKDGVLRKTGTIQKGYTIRGGGSLMLGQEQDTPGGDLDPKDSFQGYLANVNVWSYALPQHAIKQQSGSESCLIGEGDVYKWSDFRDGIRGDVRVVIRSPCYPGM